MDWLDVSAPPKESGILSAKGPVVIETDDAGLVERMAVGEWKVEEFLVALAK